MILSTDILEIPGASLVIETTEFYIQNIRLTTGHGTATFQFSISDLWVMNHIPGETFKEKYKRCLIQKVYDTGYMPALEVSEQ